MRSFRASLALAAAFALGGCGYVHFGRLPHDPATSDATMAQAYTELSTEHKILRQELALARREGDALRTALEHAAAGGSGAAELSARLEETTRELATLRASYAQLQTARAEAAGPTAAASTPLAETQQKLALSLRTASELEGANARLRADLDRARAENVSLAERLKSSAAQSEQAQAALAQLNAELLAQQDARTRAEQTAASVRAQLGVVLAARAAKPEPAGAGELSALRLAKAPPAGASGEWRTNAGRAGSAPPVATAASPAIPRRHVVQGGDTLESLAEKYYGAPDQWRRIYDANAAHLTPGQPLPQGVELVIPE